MRPAVIKFATIKICSFCYAACATEKIVLVKRLTTILYVRRQLLARWPEGRQMVVGEGMRRYVWEGGQWQAKPGIASQPWAAAQQLHTKIWSQC